MNRGQAFDLIMDSGLEGPAALILLGYLKHQSSKENPEKALSWPGRDMLARYARVSVSAAMEHRSVLKAAGILEAVEGEPGSAHKWRIRFDRLPSKDEGAVIEEGRKAKRKRVPASATVPPGVRADTPPPQEPSPGEPSTRNPPQGNPQKRTEGPPLADASTAAPPRAAPQAGPPSADAEVTESPPVARDEGRASPGAPQSPQEPLWAQAGSAPAPEPPEPAQAPSSAANGFPVEPSAPSPQRARKPPPAPDPAQDELYRAWHVYHPRAPKQPTPDTRKVLARILGEAGDIRDALLLIDWVHQGDCERARQLRGVAPWPDGKLTARHDLESLSRQVVARVEMARGWLDRKSGRAPDPPPESFSPPPSVRRQPLSPAEMIAAINANRRPEHAQS